MSFSQLEIWRDIPGYDGYQASIFGRVRRSLPARGTAVGKVLKPQNHNGNWKVFLRCHGRNRVILVGRAVLLAFCGVPPEGHVARHGVKGRDCHHLWNLSWGTMLENAADRVRDGTNMDGESNGQAKITTDIVEQIRSRYRSGNVTQNQLGLEYGLSQAQVNHIVLRNAWKHI